MFRSWEDRPFFALLQEIRQWIHGPLALSGAIATGDAVLAAQAMGADFSYVHSAFIATEEARATDAYKQAIVDGTSDDIGYSNFFTGYTAITSRPPSAITDWTRTTCPSVMPAR